MAAKTWLVNGDTVTIDILDITPEQAQQWLEGHGGRNFRDLTPEKRRQYSDVMCAGDWMFNGATIVFRKDGSLADGQKRLSACVESGAPFRSIVVWGIDEDMTYDIGERRTLAQYFTHKKEQYPAQLAAAVRWLYRIAAGSEIVSTINVPYQRLVHMLEVEHPLLRESMSATKAAADVLSHPQAAVVHYQASSNGLRTKADLFFDKVLSGVRLEEVCPIIKLRERMALNRTSKSKLDQVDRFALLILAWNYWIAGRPIRYLKWTRVGPTPMPFPKQQFGA